jgi:SnoaL-like protein
VIAEAAATSNPLRAGMEARDPAAVRAAFAPDVVLHSPIITTPFRGQDEVGDLFEVILEVLGPITYLSEHPGDPHVLNFRTDINGVEVEGVDILHLDGNGLVKEITVLLRPFPGVAAFLKATGPKLARKRGGAAKAGLISVATPPLVGLMRTTNATAPGLLSLDRDQG